MKSSQGYFVALYVGLLLLCAEPDDPIQLPTNPSVRLSLLPISSDGFKTVLGALLGSISVVLGKPPNIEKAS